MIENIKKGFGFGIGFILAASVVKTIDDYLKSKTAMENSTENTAESEES